jgi:hypothetical protein
MARDRFVIHDGWGGHVQCEIPRDRCFERRRAAEVAITSVRCAVRLVTAVADSSWRMLAPCRFNPVDRGFPCLGWGAVWLVAVWLVWSPLLASGLEVVVARGERGEQTVEGKVLVEAVDGGLLLLAQDGVLWPLQPEDILSRTRDARPFQPLTADEMAQRMLAELPPGFRVHQTAHYTICYNTSLPTLSGAVRFTSGSIVASSITGRTGAGRLAEPEFRLVALVFR